MTLKAFQKGSPERLLVWTLHGVDLLAEDSLRSSAHQAGMRVMVVVLVEEGTEPGIQIVEGIELAEMLERAFPEGPPKPLHFAAALRLAR